ncbi:hypothetical protein PV325_013657 [Microctonus aethiopoides]|nr:hypothetical protein PV325_013657 [Microctonus aethiopoides]KAK0095019.1 hypothetical protein PV326_009414 [Microctonus aethiopoides]
MLIIFRVARGPFTEEFMQCVTYGFYTEAWQEQLYTTLTLIFMFILPLIALIITYVSTVITISHNETTFKTELTNYNYANQGIGNANRTRLMQRAKNKSLRISFVIIAAFIIWWTPYYAMMIVFIFTNPDNRLSEELQDNIFFFGMSNSLVNPLIYGAFHLWPKRKNLKNINRRDGMIKYQRSGTTNSSFLRSSRSSSNPLLRTHSKSTDANVCNDTNQINEKTPKCIIDESKNHNEHLKNSTEKIE